MIEDTVVPRISNLSGSLINQIAAGEVIERPSSVVKELIENAIDSGANQIQIEINGGGTEKIIIRDNGCGIHPDDLELAILRHSTSKLRSEQDLLAINSLGFRGEALSSIASVSDLCITSKIAAAEHAMTLVFNPYTSTAEISPAARERGTTVEVNKLFKPVPARRKFLRSEKTEFLHIQDIVKRFILSRFDIDISFQHNGKIIMSCPAVESDYQHRVSTIMDKRFYENAWLLDNRTEGMHLWGWLGSGDSARNQSDRQYLFLNNRIIKDKHINHAVRKVMDEIILDGRYPSYVMHLFIETDSVDVNVHPTKQEVRFKSPRNVHDFIYAALNEAIKQGMPDQSQVNLVRDNDINAAYPRLDSLRTNTNISELKVLYRPKNEDESRESSVSPLGKLLAVLHENYLIMRYEEDIRIVDYNNLRHLYLRSSFTKQMTESGVIKRPLLVPVMLTLKESEISKLMSLENSLERLGIMIVQSGPKTLSVRSIPALLPDLDIPGLVSRFIELLKRKAQKTENIDNLCLTEILDLACSSERYHYSMPEIQDNLVLLVHLDLPYTEKAYASLWYTITETDLVRLLNAGD